MEYFAAPYGVTGIIPLDEDPCPRLKKFGNKNPAAGNYDQPSADDCQGMSGESPW
jgi:hypothetical protein